MLKLKKNKAAVLASFAQAEKRTFVDAIAKERLGYLPSRVDHPADLIRLGLIGVIYDQVDPAIGVKLAKADIPSHLEIHKTSSHALDFQDPLGTVWITVLENGGNPSMSVRPSYGWTVGDSNFRDGVVELTIFHPSGMQDDMKRKFSQDYGFPAYQNCLKEFDEWVEKMYSQLKYPSNWRELGVPMLPRS